MLFDPEVRPLHPDSSCYYLKGAATEIAKGRLVLIDHALDYCAIEPAGERIIEAVENADMFSPEALLDFSGIKSSHLNAKEATRAADLLLEDPVLSSGLLVGMRLASQQRRGADATI